MKAGFDGRLVQSRLQVLGAGLGDLAPVAWIRRLGIRPGIDVPLVVLLVGLTATRATVIFFHLAILVVVVAAMRLPMRAFVVRSFLLVPIASLGLWEAVGVGRVAAEELWELPIMALFLVTAYGLRWQRDQAQRTIDSARFRVMAGLAHDIRNPLTAAMGFAELILADEGTYGEESLTEMVRLIAHSTNEASEMINDLMTASLIQSEMLTLNREPLDVLELVRISAAQFSDNKREFPVRVLDGKAGFVGLADPLRMRQIIRNLMTNAVRYGGPHVELRVDRKDTAIVVEVTDDGSGIPPSDRELVFEPFSRSATNSHPAESVGLGLYTSRNLARMMGGDLSYRFEDHRSIFELLIPATCI